MMGNELEKRGQVFFSGGVQKEVFPLVYQSSSLIEGLTPLRVRRRKKCVQSIVVYVSMYVCEWFYKCYLVWYTEQ